MLIIGEFFPFIIKVMARYILKRFSSFPNNFSNLLNQGYQFTNNIKDRIKVGSKLDPDKHGFSLFGSKKKEEPKQEITVSPEEIKEIEKKLPKEYKILQDISKQVISEFSTLIFRSGESATRFFTETLPSFLSINPVDFIAKFAKKTKLSSGQSFGPILLMHDCTLAFYYDFDYSYWFCKVRTKAGSREVEFRTSTEFWKFLLDEFEYYKKITPDCLTNESAVKITLDYLDFNIKLIKKYGKI